MQTISAAWLYPVILLAGTLQAWSPPINGVLRRSRTNPWPASPVSFLPVVAFLACLALCLPRPQPTADRLGKLPWWAPLGGLVGALAVVAGLLFVGKVGAGTFAGLSLTANILMSLAIDAFGWFGMEAHALNGWRVLGAALMVGGVALIATFERTCKKGSRAQRSNPLPGAGTGSPPRLRRFAETESPIVSRRDHRRGGDGPTGAPRWRWPRGPICGMTVDRTRGTRS